MKTSALVVVVGVLCASTAFAQRNREPVDYNAPARFNGKPNAVLLNGPMVQAGGGTIHLDGGVAIGGSLSVTGTITGSFSGSFNGPTDGGTQSTFTGLYVNGDSILDGGLTVTGAAAFNGGMTMTGGLTVPANFSATGITGNTVYADGGVVAGTAGLRIGNAGNAITTSYTGTAAIDFGVLYSDATGPQCRISGGITVTGATMKDQCILSNDNAMDGGAAYDTDLSFDCLVTSANTGKVRACWNANDAGTVDPVESNFYLRTFGF